jgi:hypothetical protein
MVDLKSFLATQEKKKETEEYWALVIEPDWVQAGIWRILDKKAELISIGPPTAWELEEEVTGAVDTALSSASQGLPEEVSEPSKTVFGVQSSWVSEGQIKEQYLSKLKSICADLSLKPAGFVVLPEAIAHLTKSEEGTPLSAVILGISKENIELSIFKLGKLIGTSVVARSVSIAEDVMEGLTRFAGEGPVPSRFLLYDSKEGEIEEAKQALLKVNWTDFEKLKLLHTPKIESVSPDKKVLAVSLAGASEVAEVVSAEMAGKEKAIEIEKEEPERKKETLQETDLVEADVTPEELGFAVGQDVATVKERKEEKPVAESAERQVETREPQVEVVKEKPEEKLKGKFQGFRKRTSFGILGKIKERTTHLMGRGPVKLALKATGGKKILILGISFLVVLLVVGFLLWWFYPKAAVTVYVAPKKLDEKVTVVIDPSVSSPNFSERVLPGKVLKTSVSGDKTRSTTGSKTVGEQAKGEVTLYRVGPQIAVQAATTLFGPNDLRFTLDEDVTVASGSAGSPGTSKVAVTAVNIGAQYNLSSGTTFKVGNFSTSDIEAKNESDFSGGSSREISAVSSEDQEALEEDLREELEAEAKDELILNLASDESFIEGAVSATVSARTFSHKVGDEATTLKLSLSLDVSGLSANKATQADLANEVLKDKVPSGFILRPDQVKIDFEPEKEENGLFSLSALIEANLLPEINPEEIAKEISGKYPAVAEDYLIGISGFTRAEIRIKPRLPGKLGTLPRVVKNIEVVVSAER